MMDDASLSIPQLPRLRRSWIIFQLAQRALTLTALAKAEGVSVQSMSRAAEGRRSRPLMLALAKALELSPGLLFPETFKADGSPRKVARLTRRRGGENATP